MVAGKGAPRGNTQCLHLRPGPGHRNPLDQNADNAKERQQSHQRLQQKGGDILVQAFADIYALQVQLLEDGLSQKQDAQNAHHHRSGFRIDQPLPVSGLFHCRRTVT